MTEIELIIEYFDYMGYKFIDEFCGWGVNTTNSLNYSACDIKDFNGKLVQYDIKIFFNRKNGKVIIIRADNNGFSYDEYMNIPWVVKSIREFKLQKLV